jgi:hypothetical protein
MCEVRILFGESEVGGTIGFHQVLLVLLVLALHVNIFIRAYSTVRLYVQVCAS